ncbi:hypothetical protein T08_10169 [Trichinella sp. T8]|nr:hypothetical protein T08_10169 [Trichinella sp. T8]
MMVIVVVVVVEEGGGEKVEVLTKCFTAAHAVFRSTGDGNIFTTATTSFSSNSVQLMLLRLQWLKSYSRSRIVDDSSLDEERFIKI